MHRNLSACLPEQVPVPSSPRVRRPRVVVPVALDLEGPAGAGELVAHLLEKSLEGGLFDRCQPYAQFVSRVMVTAATEM